MPSFLKNPAVWAAAGALAVFGGCALAFPPDALTDAIATVIMVACIVGLFRWGPTGWRVFWKGARRTEDWGILAICVLLVAIICGRLYGIVYRQLERPDYLTDSYWSPFFLYLLLCAVTLLVAATKKE
jgi:hypothetical protein